MNRLIYMIMRREHLPFCKAIELIDRLNEQDVLDVYVENAFNISLEEIIQCN